MGVGIVCIGWCFCGLGLCWYLVLLGVGYDWLFGGIFGVGVYRGGCG